MHTFAQKPKAPQATPGKSTTPDREHFGQSHQVSSIVHLQRTIGNRAAQRSLQPGLVQRDTKGPDPKQAARARVVEAMDRLKKKFQLAEVSEEQGATWSESELAQVDASFSKLKEDQPSLKGLYLVRTSKLDSVVRKGKTFPIAGVTINGVEVKLTQGAFQGNSRTILHESGHVIQTRAAAEMLQMSAARVDMDNKRFMLGEAQHKLPRRTTSQDLAEFTRSFGQVTIAVGEFLGAGEDDRMTKKSLLDDAQTQAEIDRSALEAKTQSDPDIKAWLEAHDRQKAWAAAVEKYMEEKARKNLTWFVDLVKKNNLARKGFAPFTDYVAASWPERPEEFFAECYAVWRSDPAYMKKAAEPLFLWFERGDHRPPKVPPNRR